MEGFWIILFIVVFIFILASKGSKQDSGTTGSKKANSSGQPKTMSSKRNYETTRFVRTRNDEGDPIRCSSCGHITDGGSCVVCDNNNED